MIAIVNIFNSELQTSVGFFQRSASHDLESKLREGLMAKLSWEHTKRHIYC